MHILVTGGAGFIGSNYIRRIFDGELKGISKVTVLDKLTYAGQVSNFEKLDLQKDIDFIKGDICNADLMNSIAVNFDAIINFAAESHVDRSIEGAAEFVQTNVNGVQVLLDAIKESGRNVRFLQVSTDEVYGSIDSGSWTESQPLAPNSPYSASKAGGELLARAYFKTHGLDVVTTRCSNNYGTHHFPEKLIPLFITNLIEGKKVPVYGDGKNVRDWLHVDDHCRGIHDVLLKGKSGEIYNVGGGTELSNIEITRIILQIMGKDESSIQYVSDRKGHDQRYSVDWTKINVELGYEPQVKFELGLENTVQWYRDNESWWKPLKSH
jgi:dTDP-glucose 4,6-dehydratase